MTVRPLIDTREREERLYRGYRLRAYRGVDPYGFWTGVPETEVCVTRAAGGAVMLHLWGRNEEPLAVLVEQMAAWVDRRIEAGEAE